MGELHEDDYMMLVTLARLDRRFVRSDMLSRLTTARARELGASIVSLKHGRSASLDGTLSDILRLAGQSKLVAQ